MKKICLLFVLMIASALSMMAADQVTAKVSGSSLKIGLENETTFCAFQMDITLPEGISATAVEAVAARLSQEGEDETIGSPKFIVAHNTLEGNVLRVIAYNLKNAQIENATGDILDITLSGEVADPTVITVSNILFVNADDLSEVALDDATGENGAIRGDVNMDGKVNIYDVACVLTIMNGGNTAGMNVAVADVNNDSVVNIYDVAVILQLMK